MTKGSETRHILVFALPMFIGNIFRQLYGFITPCDRSVSWSFLMSISLGSIPAFQ
ncbi:MAG TPA: hypothetical protein GXX37_04235 [Clostridiaceae bacterium]|nr:hypothetical protein [Clostridiaceae bacterium]